MTMKYIIRGTRCRRPKEPSETFETVILASGYDDAQYIIRENWRDIWFNIRITSVAQTI